MIAQKLPFFTGEESVPHCASWKNILPLAQQCFATLLPEDFGIFVFPFGMIFCQPAILECISMVYLEKLSWQDDRLSEFHHLFPLKALRIVSNAADQALLFCPHVLLRSAHSIWPSPSRPRDFQTFTLQP